MKLKILAIATFIAPFWLPTATYSQTLNITPSQSLNEIVQTISADWERFSSDEGGFSVLVPETPSQQRAGEGYSFMVQDDSGVFTIAYSDFPEVAGQVAPEEFLEAASQGFFDGGAKILNQRPISLGEYPGREVAFEMPQGITGTSRLYLVQDRLYFLIAVAPDADNATTFLDSFELTN